MDRLEVLRLDAVPEDVGVPPGTRGDVAHQIFDKDRIGVGALGHEFLIGALEQAVEFRAGRVLHQPDHLLDPHRLGAAHRVGHVTALIVGTRLADRLGAGAEGRDRDDHGDDEVDLSLRSARERGAEAHGVVEQAHGTRHGGGLLDEVGKFEVDVRLVALKPFAQLDQNIADVGGMKDGAMGVERLDEAAHVGSLEMVGKVDRQLHRGDRRLLAVVLVADTDRVAEVLDPDAVDRDPPVIGKILRVGKRFVCGHGKGVRTRRVSVSWVRPVMSSPRSSLPLKIRIFQIMGSEALFPRRKVHWSIGPNRRLSTITHAPTRSGSRGRPFRFGGRGGRG